MDTKNISDMKYKNISIMVSKIRLLLRLSQGGISQRRIAKKLELSRTSVKVYMDRLLSSGKSFEELEKLDDKTLLSISLGEIYRQQPDYRYELLKPLLEKYAKDSKRRYVTIQLLWEEYAAEFKEKAYSYSSFKHYVKKYIDEHTYKYHNTHTPGAVLQVDFAGDKLYVTDTYNGELIPVEILCCTLPCSNYSFVIALPNATMDHLFYGISQALEYIGGVPEKLLSDNMKQWVKSRDKNCPTFTDAALECGLHYNTGIEATGVRKPKHKASVEGTVHIVYQRIYASIRDEEFHSIKELNNRITELLELYNNRKMKDKPYSRYEFFIQNEAPYLSPLPDKPFSLKYTKQEKVGSDYHISVTKHKYSVPYEYVGQEVTIIYDIKDVEVYNSTFERITSHKRSFAQYGHSTKTEHMPPAHLAYELKKGVKNAASYLYRAGLIAPIVQECLQKVLDRNIIPEQGYRSCEAILQLQFIDKEALIKSCDYAVKNLKYVNARILKTIMDNKSYMLDSSKEDNGQFIHSNLRGKESFMS